MGKEGGDLALIAPTVDITFFVIDGTNKQRLTDLVKDIVYKPAKDSKSDKFRLAAHGVIFQAS